MKTMLLAVAVILSPFSAFALDNPGPITLGSEITVCRNPYDHLKSVEFVKHDPMVWVRFREETRADGRCYDIPAGRRVFAAERVRQPDFMECIRVEGETSCGWSLPYVALQQHEASSRR